MTEWPHDPDGEAGSEGGRKYGLAVLVKMVDPDDFPLSRDDFVAEHGDAPVRIDHRRVVSVADVFEHVGDEEFDSLVGFHRAAGDAIRTGEFQDYAPGPGARS